MLPREWHTALLALVAAGTVSGVALAGNYGAPQCGHCRSGCLHDHWQKCLPPRGAVVYSVPAVMTPQQALAIDVQQFRTLALAAEPQKQAAYAAEPSKTVEQRLSELEYKIRILTETLGRLAQPPGNGQ